MKKLKQLLGLDSNQVEILGYSVDLNSDCVYDSISKRQGSQNEVDALFTLLAHYSTALSVQEIGRLLKFHDLPGGYAYWGAFLQRAVQPIEQIFGCKSQALIKAAEFLGGTTCSYGDVSVRVTPLKGIPLVYVLWGADEFPASATVLFDESASQYLPTEDLAVLSELTTRRLTQLV